MSCIDGSCPFCPIRTAFVFFVWTCSLGTVYNTGTSKLDQTEHSNIRVYVLAGSSPRYPSGRTSHLYPCVTTDCGGGLFPACYNLRRTWAFPACRHASNLGLETPTARPPAGCSAPSEELLRLGISREERCKNCANYVFFAAGAG